MRAKRLALALCAVPVSVAAAEPVLSLAGTLPASCDDDATLAAIDGIGAEATSLTLFWDELERDGRHAADPDRPAIAEAVYPARGTAIHLTFLVIDTVADRRPADQKGLPWDNPRVVARFEAFLGELLDRMPGTRLLGVALGNEVDGVLTPEAYPAYARSFDAARAAADGPGRAGGVSAT